MGVTFTDNSINIKAQISDKTAQFLEEAGAEIESQAIHNTRVQSGQTKRNWKHTVNSVGDTVTIGNTEQNAAWEEFGTGEYALAGDGRRGGWYVCTDMLDAKTKSLFESKYTFKKSYGKNGKEFYFVLGKKPTRALHNAYADKKATIINHANTLFGGVGK